MTKTAIHRPGPLEAGQSHRLPMLKSPTLQQKKNMFISLVQKIILIYIANFALNDNCEGVKCFITHPFESY